MISFLVSAILVYYSVSDNYSLIRSMSWASGKLELKGDNAVPLKLCHTLCLPLSAALCLIISRTLYLTRCHTIRLPPTACHSLSPSALSLALSVLWCFSHCISRSHTVSHYVSRLQTLSLTACLSTGVLGFVELGPRGVRSRDLDVRIRWCTDHYY